MGKQLPRLTEYQQTSAIDGLAAGVDTAMLDNALALEPGSLDALIARGKQNAGISLRYKVDIAARELWKARAKAVTDRAVAAIGTISALSVDDDAPANVRLRAAAWILEREVPESYHRDLPLLQAIDTIQAALMAALSDKTEADAIVADLRARLELDK